MIVTLKNASKTYGKDIHAVKNLNLEIDHKEFVVLVGPSGCGKSTTLRLIAGLEELSAGDIFFDEKKVNNVEPRDRDIAMVFQNYALYPHMSVRKNIGFGLKMRKIHKEIIRQQVQEASEYLGIAELLDRKPRALSGGQKQRVALGRAMVREPAIFLLDEPLSNLDSQLREDMRTIIKRIHDDLGTTTVYVTHDLQEAEELADRIIEMKDGEIDEEV